MNNTEKMYQHLATIKPGTVMKCIRSIGVDFEVGKLYTTTAPSDGFFIAPEINGGYSMNYHKNGYYGVDTGKELLATLVMIRDYKGRYVKRNRNIKPKARQDFRRIRRMARNLIKNDIVGSYEYKVIREVANYAGK